MSWSRRRLLLLLPILAASLGGCGFHPLYAEQSTFGYDPELAAIKVRPIPERVGQILTTSLRERFNPEGAAVDDRYELSVSLTVSVFELGIQVNATAIRSEVTMTANYVLTDLKSHAQLYKATSTARASFNYLNDAFATTVADQDARQRALRDLSEQIGIRLALFLRDRKQDGKSTG